MIERFWKDGIGYASDRLILTFEEIVDSFNDWVLARCLSDWIRYIDDHIVCFVTRMGID